MRAPKLTKLEDSPLWKEVNAIAEHMYARLGDFPQEEQWHTREKMRSATVELVFWTALAAGNPGPTGVDYEWGIVRKYAAALKTVYRFAGREKMIELDPQMMLRLSKLQDHIDAELTKAHASAEAYRLESDTESLQPWKEKYDIWKKLNEGTL